MATTTSKFDANPSTNRTLASQGKLPKLPVPSLEDTCKRYLTALQELQDGEEHAQTKKAVQAFLDGEGPAIQKKLQEWAATKDR